MTRHNICDIITTILEAMMERVSWETLIRESRRRCDGGIKTREKNAPELAEERSNVSRTAREAA